MCLRRRKKSPRANVIRSLMLVLLVSGMLMISISTLSIGTSSGAVCLRQQFTSAATGENCPPHLIVKLGGQVAPRELPKHKLVPVTVSLWGKITTDNGSHPYALREVTISFGKNVLVEAVGLPACKHWQLEVHDTSAAMRVCHGSIVGRGVAHVAIDPSGRRLIRLPLTLFNGGVRNGTTILFIRAPSIEPNQVPTMAVVKLRKIHGSSHHGLQAVAMIPQIVGGSGSLIDFNLRVRRSVMYDGSQKSYAMAKCPGGRLDGEVTALFKNETKIPSAPPQAILKSRVNGRCTSKR